MARTIHKFELAFGATTVHLMDPDARILACGNQRERFVLWAELDPHAPTVPRSFTVYATGEAMDEPCGDYLGTVLFTGGALVFHAYALPADVPLVS